MKRFGSSRTRIGCAGAVLGFALAALAPQAARAQNAAFQSFFFDVCASPTGALAARCAETPGAAGDLSGDSEDSLNPSQALAINQSALARARALQKEIQQRAERRRDEGLGEQTAGAGPRWSLLTSGRAEYFDREETRRERGLDGVTWGLQLGGDVQLGEGGFVGALLAYDRTDAEFDRDARGVNFTPPGNDGSTDADLYSLTFYGSWSLTDAVYVDGSLGYGYADYTFRRRAVFQETGRAVPQTGVRTEEDTEGHELSASGGIGYDWRREAFSLGPYLRLNYVWTKVDGYTERDETGSGLAMRIGTETQRSLATVLGLRGSYAFSTGWGVLIPQARVEWEHEFEQDTQSVLTRFVLDAGGNRFDVKGDSPDRDFLNASAGLLLLLPNGWMPFLDYEGLFGHSYYDRHRVTIGLRKEL